MTEPRSQAQEGTQRILLAAASCLAVVGVAVAVAVAIIVSTGPVPQVRRPNRIKR